MGGHDGGEIASMLAVKTIEEYFKTHWLDELPSTASIREAIERANQAIYELNQQENRKGSRRMGTTLVMVQFYDNRMAVAHVGDSRLYRVRDGELMQITRDHSLLQDQLDSGLITPEEARYSHNKNLVTRALGVEEDVKTDVAEHAVLPGDVYLLCSDGLNDMVDDEDIALTLSSLSANLPLCAQQLIDLANDNGGRDNVSVVLVKIRMAFPASDSRPGWKNKLQSWFG